MINPIFFTTHKTALKSASLSNKHIFMAMPRERQAGFDYDEAASAGGCGCFQLFFCCGWKQSSSSQGEGHSLLQERGVHEETWLVTRLKELKEYSELVAGPTWKNMIRKIGKFCNPKKKPTQFQYSPGSYAMNFDCDEREEEDNLLHSFSSRFASHAFNDPQRKNGLVID